MCFRKSLLTLFACLFVLGCVRKDPVCKHACEPTFTGPPLLEIEDPCVGTCVDDALIGMAPRSIEDLSDINYRDVGLEEVIHIALANSKVMRDLGGTILRAPATMRTTLDPAVQETDAQFGVEAALSEFDAMFEASYFAEKIDRRLNNRFLGDLGFLNGDAHEFEAGISKRNALGSQFSVRHLVDFDRDNALGNQFPNGAYTARVEAEARHPLLQGGGLDFNRIAGPNSEPGDYNGVLIARTRTDVTLAEFEIGVRDFVSNVENAYWDLYFSYRDLDAKKRARDVALETWRRIQALNETGRRGGEAEKEAQAREQYFRFEADVQNALAGRPLDGTRTNNGSRAGTFRGLPGVLVSERRLRLLIGLPPSDGDLLRPVNEPTESRVWYSWDDVSRESLSGRSELRRQRWNVKRRELELVAARNHLLPSLDLVAMYRWRGFGDDLISPNRGGGRTRFDNAYMDLTTGDFQESQLGVELSMPIGFRQAHAGVRNAQLSLARERALQREQERQILHDLGNAIAEMERAFVLVQTNYNRLVAARQQQAAVQSAFDEDKVDFFVVLNAHRRLAEAEIEYYRTRVEYGVSIKNVHFEKGSLLPYCGVDLAEGAWRKKAYEDAHRLAQRRKVKPGPKSSPVVAAGRARLCRLPAP